MTGVRQLPDNAVHVLVVDDDARLRELIDRYLAREGFRCTLAASAEEARRKLGGFVFDAIVLDVMMPGESGFDLIQAIRDRVGAPILMLTALAEAPDRIRGLEWGADDYLTKPFEPRELALRIRNLVKRSLAAGRTAVIRFGPFVYDARSGELQRDGELIRLTDRERHLMGLFAERPGESIPRHHLMPEDEGLGDRAVDVQINRLRRKIEDDPANPRYLQTIRGAGYRLIAEPQD